MKNSWLAVALLFAAVPTRAAGPVVVELFTSQGCSSCPDADALLSSWGRAGFAKGELLPLSFDVDYWDYLGWKDVFSTPAWSARQSSYASALGDRTYTPQMVVAGREAFVGSDGRHARVAASKFYDQPARAELTLKSLPSKRARVEIVVKPSKNAAGLRVMLALFENDLATEVKSGENGGRTLRSDFVVRRLVELGTLQADTIFRRALDESWEPSWKKDHAGAALFLQDPKTLAVYDARSVFPL